MLYYSHMAGFSERLSAMKGKQEASEQMKREQAEKAAEAARLEREAKRSELSAERDTVMAEFTQAEQTANEAREAIAQADTFATEQGENLDPEAKAEIDAMKVEAGEVQQRFEELETRLDELNTEISAFEGSEELQETSTEATAEVVGQEDHSEATQESTEDKEQKLKMQEEADQRAFALREEVLQAADLYDDPYATSEKIQAALQPTFDKLSQSGNLLDYLALKSLKKLSVHIDIPRAAINEDPTTLDRARKEILTAEQNQEIDERLKKLGEGATLALKYQADKAGVSVEEFLSTNPDFLTQADKNALEFRPKVIAELSPEDRTKTEEQENAKLGAIKKYDGFREKNLKRTEEMSNRGGMADRRFNELMKEALDSELQRLQSEGKVADYLALRGVNGPDVMANDPALDGYGVKDLAEIIAKEDPATIENLRKVLTKEQSLALDQRLPQAK